MGYWREADEQAAQPTDAELVRRTLAGDAEAFDSLARRYRGLVLNIARAMVWDWDQAEDVAQQALLEAYTGLGGLREPARLRAWLTTITRRCALRSRASGEPSALPLTEGMIESLAPHPPRDGLCERVRESVQELTARSRRVVTLHYLDGYTCREIGLQLEVPEGTVKRILHDARTALRSRLGAPPGTGRGAVTMRTRTERPATHCGPRELIWWINGSAGPERLWEALPQSICLAANKHPMTAAQIGRAVGAAPRYVQDALAPLVAEDLVEERPGGRFLAHFIALDATDWIDVTRGLQAEGARLADALARRLPDLERAWQTTSLPGRGFTWRDGIWPMLALFVCGPGISRAVPLEEHPRGGKRPELHPPLRAGGHRYWVGGHEAARDEHELWNAGFQISSAAAGISYGFFWSRGLNRLNPGRNNAAWGAVLAALHAGARSAEAIAGRAGLPLERTREVLAEVIQGGLVAREGGRLALTFPVLGPEESGALLPAVDAVAAEITGSVLLPATAGAAEGLRSAGYGHLEEQFPVWRGWLEGNVAGEALHELLRRGILPDPGDPAPVRFALIGWQEPLPLLSWRAG